MKELSITIRDEVTGETKKEEFVVSDDTLPEVVTTLTIKNINNATNAERGGLKIAKALLFLVERKESEDNKS